MPPGNTVVLHISPTPFFADRGCHIRIRNEVRALDQRGYTPVVCTYHLGSDVEGMDIRRTWRIPGYTKLTAGFSPYRFVADFLLFWVVLGVAVKERPVLLHGHLHEGVVIGWLVKYCLFWRKLPLIMDMQGSLTGELIDYGTLRQEGVLVRALRRIEQLICRMPDKIFCSSVRSRAVVQTAFGIAAEKTVLVPDVVPEMFFSATPCDNVCRYPLNPEFFTGIYTGSLLPGKGLESLLDAVRLFLEQEAQAQFILLGYPVEEAELFVRRHHLDARVFLVGQRPYEELRQWLALADIAVEPKREASGEASGKVLHYMAAGLAVVCFDTENNRALLGDGAFVSSKLTAEGLAEALHVSKNEVSQRKEKGTKNRQLVAEVYSTAAVGALLEKEYARLHGDFV